MTAVVVALETLAQRDERLGRECEAVFGVHMAERTLASHEALTQAVQRWAIARLALLRRWSAEQTASVPDAAA
jgi:hypothetical protein